MSVNSFPQPEEVPPPLTPPAQLPEATPATPAPAPLRPLGNLAARPLAQPETPPDDNPPSIKNYLGAAVQRIGAAAPAAATNEQPDDDLPDVISPQELERLPLGSADIEFSDADNREVDSGGAQPPGPPGPPAPPSHPEEAEPEGMPPTEATRRDFADVVDELRINADVYDVRTVEIHQQVGDNPLNAIEVDCVDHTQDRTISSIPEIKRTILVSRNEDDTFDEFRYHELAAHDPDRDRADAILDELATLRQDPALTDWLARMKGDADTPPATVGELLDNNPPQQVKHYADSYDIADYWNGTRIEVALREPVGDNTPWDRQDRSQIRVQVPDRRGIFDSYTYTVELARGMERMDHDINGSRPLTDDSLRHFTELIRDALASGRRPIPGYDD